MVIFVDIDGTLTENGEKANAKVIQKRIDKLIELAEKHEIFVWSARGYKYVLNFAENNGLLGYININFCEKPDLIIDDNPTIRPNWDKRIESPEFLD